MKSFKEFINESILAQKSLLVEAVRTGLSTIHSSESKNVMDHNQLHDLIHTGKVHLHDVTEKTDGSVYHLHYDNKGFGTQYSGSGDEIMRSKADYHTRAKRRAQETGKEYNSTVPEGFGKFHEALAKNKGLQAHMKAEYERTGQPVHIKGEAFNRNLGEHHDDGTHSTAVTHYDTSHMGTHGKFVVHSKLPGNEHHQDLAKHSDSNVTLDDDKIPFKHTSIDVNDEAEKLKNVNHELLNSRTTKSNKEAKEAEKSKVSDIAKTVSKKVNDAVAAQKIKPKWSKVGASEGFVVHPVGDQPRFKVLAPEFTKTKSSEEYKNKWKAK